MTRRTAILAGAGAFAASGITGAAEGRLRFESSDQRLVDGFNWAKRQALSYVFHGDAVGDWYEAALPKRSAFCMRDVSHQSTGAQVLGLAPLTRNMLKHFAANIAESRDWCTYWEIEKSGRAAPVDYKDDKDFWYCLPANFDLLHACYRQYLWTADHTYLDDGVFRNFYDRTLTDYVKRWDKDGDGIPESYPKYGRRGIGSYTENFDKHVLMGGDLIAAEYAAMRIAGLSTEAERLKTLYNRDWWDAKNGRFFTAKLQDGSFYTHNPVSPFDLYFGIPESGRKTEAALDRLLNQAAADVEELSYVPEIAYRYGRAEAGYAKLLELTDPGLRRREYPEVSFAAIGAIATGLMGISPDAREGVVKVEPRLTKQTGWATLVNLPVFSNEITVRHTRGGVMQVTNQSGPAIRCRVRNTVVVHPGETRALG